MMTSISRKSLLVVLPALLLVSGLIAAAQSVPADYYAGLKWRLIGPFRGGRAAATAGVPGDGTTFYFGAVDGGIWKTTDAGMVWMPIFDRQDIASIGALAVAPSDPKVIYAGTGESDIRSNLSSGDGVYKSTDGGQTWKNIGLHDSRQISRIVIDPHDANVVYVGVLGHAYAPNQERGVYKSLDGGANWTKILDQGTEIGVADLSMAADEPNVLFASTWHTWRPPWSTYAPIDGPDGRIFRSKDAGQSWTRLSGNGLPDGNWGRVAIAVSRDGKHVYALIDDAQKSGLYRSDNGGDTWMLQNSDKRLTSRAWYFGNITIDPQNADVIYVPNVALYRSEDGGKTISIVRGAPGGDDYHQIWIDPQNSARMVLATDQGTTISLDYGKTWSSWYNQPTAQLYHVITDDRFPYIVYGAQQDSGSVAVYSRTDHGQITPRDWFPPAGSESGYIAPDPKNPDIFYVSETYGGVGRFDRRTSFSQDITPWPFPIWGTDIAQRKYRDPWTPVLVFSPFDKTTLYLGTQYVMKTIDGGLHWQQISPDLTGATQTPGTKTADAKNQAPPTVDNAKQRGYGVVFSIAPSSLDGGLIWAGSDTSLIHLTRDEGKTWKDVTPKAIGNWSRISLIEASHFDPGEAYAAVDRHRLDDRAPYLYRTRDYGATWQLITNGIPAQSFLRAVREDPDQKGLLYAGTELGIYVSFDDGDHWQSLQLNLPVTSVQDMTIHGDDLVIATHGRSIWILDDITPLRQVRAAQEAASDWLYRPATAVRVDNDSFLGTPLPPEEPTAENPPNGAVIDYFLKSSAEKMKLEILDGAGNLVRSVSSQDTSPEEKTGKRPPVPIADRWFPKPQTLEKSAGMHRFVWNLAWGPPESPDGEDTDEEYGAPRGPRAAPGNYEVRLTVDGKTCKQPLQVSMDPRSAATPGELEQQVQLGRQIFAEILRGRKILAEISSVQKQLTNLQSKLNEHPELKTGTEDAAKELKNILAGASEDASAMGLQTASSGLGSALHVVESSDQAVPAQALEVYRGSSDAMKRGSEAWSEFKTTRLRQLNQQLPQANLPPITAKPDGQAGERLRLDQTATTKQPLRVT
jgi:photosystem II stability/assembly factor-like uncharacterized protein